MTSLQDPRKAKKKGESSTILPLLEFTLTQLWERQQDGVLTHEAYRRLGGITGGLRQWSNTAYYRFEERLRPLVRRIFTSLVYLGDEEQHIADSRRRRTVSTLAQNEADRKELSETLLQLVTDRLLVSSYDQEHHQELIEIIHDALLWEWTLLKQWIADDRTFLRWYQQLERQAQAWSETRDTDKLLRGTDLTQALDYLRQRHDELHQLEREFILASQNRRRFERQRRTLIITGGSAVLGLALLGGPTTLTIENFLNNTVFEKQNLLHAVEALQPGVMISDYKKLFGEPKLVNVNAPSSSSLNRLPAKEYVFVKSYFYLDAVTDMNDMVKYFALTLRDKTFNPTFQSPDYPLNEGSFHFTLGKSPFQAIPTNPLSLSGCLGVHDVYYHEIHYLGRPGNYEQFGFGLNEAGYIANIQEDFIPFLEKIQLCYPPSPPWSQRPTYTQQDWVNLQPMRTKTIFNTYAISAPGVSFNDYNASIDLGVIYDQVRPLSP